MRIVSTKIAATAAALALLASAPASAASSAPAPSATPNGWVTFSQLNPAGATAMAGSSAVSLAGSTAVAAQPDEDGAYRQNPFPWPVAVVLLGVVAAAIYIAFIEKHHGHFNFPSPNSPS